MNDGKFHCHSDDSAHLLACEDRSCQDLAHSTHVIRWTDGQTGSVNRRYGRFESDGQASEVAQSLGGTADSQWHYVRVQLSGGPTLVMVQG